MLDVLEKFKSASETDKQILANTTGSFIIRGASLVVSLFTMPAYMRYFQDQKILGLWFTILAVLTWILNFDLGIGNGLRNRLVKSLVEKDILSCRTYISSAYILLSIVVSFCIIIGYIVFPFINWNSIFNISPEIVSKELLLRVVRIVFIGIVIQFILKLINSILYALQKSAIPNLIGLISSILLLLFVLFGNSGNMENNLVMLAQVNILTTNIPLLIVTIIVFLTRLKPCFPRIKYFKLHSAFDVIKLGGIFFWLQIMSLLITSTNEFIITWLSGPGKVVEYQVYNKLFNLAGTIFSLALTPIWSAVTKSFAENNFLWLSKLYKRLKFFAAISILGEFSIIPFLQFLVNLWLGDKAIKINYMYALIFAISGSAFIWSGVISSIVNGIGKLRIQFIWLTFGAILNFPLSWILYHISENWIVIIIANIASLLPYCLIQPIWINKYLKDKNKRSISNVVHQ